MKRRLYSTVIIMCGAGGTDLSTAHVVYADINGTASQSMRQEMPADRVATPSATEIGYAIAETLAKQFGQAIHRLRPRSPPLVVPHALPAHPM